MTKPDIRESPWTQYDLSNSQFFPLKLMTVLSMIEFNDISQWTDSGKAFRIMDPARFESEVMVDHFKRAKFASFLRKLRRWGFLRIYRGPDSGAYYHKNFQRGNIAAALEMSCVKQEPSHALKSRNEAPKVVGSRAFSRLPVVEYDGSTYRLVRGTAASLPKSPPATPGSRNILVESDATTDLHERNGTFRRPTSTPGGHFTSSRDIVHASAHAFLQSQRTTEPARLRQSELSRTPSSQFHSQQSDMSLNLQFSPNINPAHFSL